MTRPKRGRPLDPTRQAALVANYLFYAGKPCKRGHGGKRYVSTGACVDCYAGTGSGSGDETRADEFADIFN